MIGWSSMYYLMQKNVSTMAVVLSLNTQCACWSDKSLHLLALSTEGKAIYLSTVILEAD